MADDNTAYVRIVGDASEVAPATDEAKGEIASIAPMLAQLNSSMAEMTAGMREGFAQVSAALAGTKEELKQVEEETAKESFSLRELGAAMKETALSVHEGVEGFNRFKAGLSEIMEVYMAFVGVEMFGEMAEKMGEAAEQTQHLAQRFGMTAAQVQAMQGVAISTGVSFDTLTHGMTLLDKTAETTPEKFKKLGIEVKAGASQMDILLATADRFKDMPDGPAKTAAAMELMGKNGAAMLPILNEGAEGIKELTQKSAEYGLVNKEAQASGLALAESVNEGKLAWAGLKETLSGAFAPLLKEMVDGFNGLVKSMTASYQSGGAVKVIFEGLVAVVEGFGEIFNSIGSAIKQMFGEMGGSAADWKSYIQFNVDALVGVFKVFLVSVVAVFTGVGIGFDLLKAAALEWYARLKENFGAVSVAIDALKIAFQTFGQVAVDALTLNWDKINSDWQAGVDKLVNTVQAGAAKLKSDVASIRADAQGALDDAHKAGAAFGDWYAKFNQPHEKPKSTGVEGGGGTGDTPDLTKQPKERKQRAPKDDTVQKLEEELTAKKQAWSAEQDAQDSAQQFSLASEADFWKAALGQANLSAKDRQQIEAKYLAAHGAMIKQQIQGVLDGYKTQLDAHKGNAAEQLEITKQEAEFIKGKFGEESNEYKRAQDGIVQAAQRAAQQREQIELNAQKAIEQLRLQGLTDVEEAEKFRVSMGVETQGELLKHEMQFEQSRYDIQKAALEKQIAIENANGKDLTKLAALHTQELTLDAQFEAKKTQLMQQAALERTRIERGAVQSISSSWGQAIGQMVTLQKSFAATIQSLWKGLQQAIGNAIGSIIEDWLSKHLSALIVGGTASKASAAGEIANQAALAGAGGVASMAAAPWPTDMGAPGFGAAMAAAAGSYATLLTVPGFDVGAWNLSKDQLAMVHGGEMIVPAAEAGGWRNVMSLFADMPKMTLPAGLTSPIGMAPPAANSNGPAPANDGGGITVNYHDHSGSLSPTDIINNRSAVAKALRMAHREGAFAGTKLNF